MLGSINERPAAKAGFSRSFFSGLKATAPSIVLRQMCHEFPELQPMRSFEMQPRPGMERSSIQSLENVHADPSARFARAGMTTFLVD